MEYYLSTWKTEDQPFRAMALAILSIVSSNHRVHVVPNADLKHHGGYQENSAKGHSKAAPISSPGILFLAFISLYLSAFISIDLLPISCSQHSSLYPTYCFSQQQSCSQHSAPNHLLTISGILLSMRFFRLLLLLVCYCIVIFACDRNLFCNYGIKLDLEK